VISIIYFSWPFFFFPSFIHGGDIFRNEKEQVEAKQTTRGNNKGTRKGGKMTKMIRKTFLAFMQLRAFFFEEKSSYLLFSCTLLSFFLYRSFCILYIFYCIYHFGFKEEEEVEEES
jgi:hypothetical protein